MKSHFYFSWMAMPLTSVMVGLREMLWQATDILKEGKIGMQAYPFSRQARISKFCKSQFDERLKRMSNHW